jgi:hypothetical protein
MESDHGGVEAQDNHLSTAVDLKKWTEDINNLEYQTGWIGAPMATSWGFLNGRWWIIGKEWMDCNLMENVDAPVWIHHYFLKCWNGIGDMERGGEGTKWRELCTSHQRQSLLEEYVMGVP